jgi:hypothetical protein
MFDTSVLKQALADTAAAPKPSGENLQSSHLYTADWQILLDYLDDVGHGEKPSGSVELSMPMIDAQIARLEQSLETQRAEIAPTVHRQISKSLKTAKRQAAGLINDLEWLAGRLLERGEQENHIWAALDSVLSVGVNRVIAKIGDCPQMEHAEEFTAYVLGIPDEDLLQLAFGTQDLRSISAYIPIDFLLEVRKLNEIGDELPKKCGAATRRQKAFAACQLFHAFDFAFSSAEKKALWYRFYRAGREGVIDNPRDVVRFGLNDRSRARQEGAICGKKSAAIYNA